MYTKMGIERITKEEFDKQFNNMVIEVENTLNEYMDVYKKLLEFNRQYLKDYNSYKIRHYIENETLKYEKEKRIIGFKQ